MRLIWREDGNLLTRKVSGSIPDDFHGRLLDVPVDTAISIVGKYRRMKAVGIVGLDYSEEMIAIATLQEKTEDIDNLSLVQGDVGELPYVDESFDYVLSMNGLQAFPDKDKTFIEIFRAPKPRSRFCGCFYVRGERQLGGVLIKKILGRRGFFHPPYDTFAEADNRFRSMYGDDIQTEKTEFICLFHCTKPQKTSSKENNNPRA